jgi:hypothetical protein
MASLSLLFKYVGADTMLAHKPDLVGELLRVSMYDGIRKHVVALIRPLIGKRQELKRSVFDVLFFFSPDLNKNAIEQR